MSAIRKHLRFLANTAALSLGFGWFASNAYGIAPLAATVTKSVQVAAALRTAPFDAERHLQVPPGFSIAVMARVPGARFLAVAPNGDVLVSQPGAGKIALIRQAGGESTVSTFAENLRKPHDMVFHKIGRTTYLYLAETHQISRSVYLTGDDTSRDRQVVVGGLPDNSSPELRGRYGHELKNIALGPDHRLYVAIASTCNACLEDTVSDPVRGSIYRYGADGTGGRLFARGLRNAEGLAFVPGTSKLWAAVNNRDNTPYPYDDGSHQLGQVIPDFVDNYPPEEFTWVREGGNYGWPFCNPDPNTPAGMRKMPFNQDQELNADGHVNCAAMEPVDQGLTAHSAPLGVTFLQGTRFSRRYRDGVVIALHGSWNRQSKSGYQLVHFRWNKNKNRPEDASVLISGWLDEGTQTAWGRPVDTAVDSQGNLLVSDDQSGTIYKLSQEH